MSELAILGGLPIRNNKWPTWPTADERTLKYLADVLYSGRWGIGGKYNGTPLYNTRFETAFAEFHEVAYCITVANGSAALAIALEALGVQPGDEVIIPGLAWISCATAVTRIGAVPILVDIEPETLCISLISTRDAISERTKVIMVVHAYCTVADLDAFVRLSKETGIPLLEDCSQAHGAQWNNKRVGKFGKISVFSMGNSKVLSCGEGGAIITDDPYLYDILQQLRGDGYRYKNTPPRFGESQIEEIGAVQGYNYCLSEFQAAVLLGSFADLDRLNEVRETNGEYFRELCAQIGDVAVSTRHTSINRLTFFRLCVRFNLEAFGGASIAQIRDALIAELNESTLEFVDHPLNRYVLYKPMESVGARSSPVEQGRYDPKQFDLPIALESYKECLTFHHLMLLGSKDDVEDIAKAIIKLRRNAKILPTVRI